MAQLVNRWTGDLKIGSSRLIWDTLSLNPFSLVSNGSLTDIRVDDFMLL